MPNKQVKLVCSARKREFLVETEKLLKIYKENPQDEDTVEFKGPCQQCVE